MPNTPFNQVQQEQIIAALFRREENRTIIETHHVSERQLRRITKNLKNHGTFHAPSTKKMGRPTCLNKEIEEDLRQYVAAQPLALLVDMQKYVQEKYKIKCSRASLSRRIREMGYTRGIIRRGFRSDDQEVPQISPADMLRIMGDPSPDEEMMTLPPNAKKARYAWLLDGEKQEKRVKKPRKKAPEASQESPEITDPVDPAITNPTTITAGQLPQVSQTSQAPQVPQGQPQGLSQSPPQPISANVFSQTPIYISPYRQVTASGGLVISGHPMDPNRDVSQHRSPQGSMPVGLT